ncbi:MAG: YkgJ family cysteine cluster protein [Methanomicrobiales archaeon]|nr:YkgJ family cysteine cluster protein [Methanomicrobiales archaeon]
MACECCQCGECCSHMRLVHSITARPGRHTFVVTNHYSGEVKEVRVDPDKIALFEDTQSIASLPEACPFLRFSPESGKAWCTVHATRPEICRDYCCWRLLILDAAGQRAGRVLYQRTFLADAPALSRIWEEMKHEVQGLDDSAWDEAIVRTLVAAGYRVRR